MGLHGRGDTLGVFVAGGAIVGVLGLSLVIGPDRTAVGAVAAADAPVVAPVEVAPRPEPEPEAAPEVREPPAPPPPVPTSIRIGSIAIAAPIVPVGLADDLSMEIPDRVDEVGWYDPDGIGVRPGTQGTAVLSSHVDSRSQGRGVLFDLRLMRVGETIEIDLEDGTVQRWRVSEVTQYPKTAMPLEDIFTWAGPSRLAIITCGGEFDRAARSYRDNVVVLADLDVVGPAA